MTAASARLRGGVLLYAALQFVVLTTIAMRVYAGGTVADPRTSGYDFFNNFFSDLGATYSWSGAPNHVSSVLFGIALGSLGAAFVAFAGTWRAFAFARGRARAAGIAAHVFGTLSGAAFVTVAVAPVNRALAIHNTAVVAAFGLLLGYAACMTFVWWRNGATAVQRATSIAYLVLVGVYFAVVAEAVHLGVFTDRGRLVLVGSQKAIVYASMLYIIYVTISTRRQLA